MSALDQLIVKPNGDAISIYNTPVSFFELKTHSTGLTVESQYMSTMFLLFPNGTFFAAAWNIRVCVTKDSPQNCNFSCQWHYCEDIEKLYTANIPLGSPITPTFYYFFNIFYYVSTTTLSNIRHPTNTLRIERRGDNMHYQIQCINFVASIYLAAKPTKNETISLYSMCAGKFAI